MSNESRWSSTPLGQTGGLLVLVMISACRIYEPTVLDCRVTCAVDGSCPVDTVCREGFCRVPAATSRCDCRDGETRPCGSSVGACEAGVQTCVGTEWGACEGAVTSNSEACNGLDDDCDGVVDEPIAIVPPCARTLGVCSGAAQVCSRGAWAACTDFSYGPDFELDEQRCDGLDNDCDGIDDGTRAVLLAETTGERWFFLATSRGYALLIPNDAGTELRWLTPQLGLEQQRQLNETIVEATSVGDAVITATQTDAGVVFDAHELDGGTRTLAVVAWSSPSLLDVEREVAAAVVAGVVQVVSLSDGGAPAVVGASTGPTLKLSQTGGTLAWSGGLVRTADLTTLSTTPLPPLLAVLELPGDVIAGVPAARAGAPAWFADLENPGTSLRISERAPPLTQQSATVHEGQVLIGGVDDVGTLRLVSPTGHTLLEEPRNVLRPQLVSGPGRLPVVASQSSGRVLGVRRCSP